MPTSGPDLRRRGGMAVRWTGWAAIAALGAGCLVFPAAARAQPDDAAISDRGQQLYAEHCTRCHGATGEGNPPTFPALSGNNQLEDAARIVQVIGQGSGNMPPFPTLTTADIAALASYVRNAWTNSFGGVSADTVAAEASLSADADRTTSVWDGVFTDDQAVRGQSAYSGACSFCHGRRLNGAPDDPDMRSSPPLARARFLREWEGRSLATLYEYTRLTMPEDNPNSLADEEYADIIAYLLSASGMPAGDDELAPDSRSLARIVIRQQQ